MVVMQLPSGNEILVVKVELPSSTPETVFDYWTRPSLIEQWWPPHAEVQPEVGGTYHFSWPTRNWHLRGVYTSFEPGKKLAFTWRWDHDPDDVMEREVAIVLEPLVNGGTSLVLTHGSYANTKADQELRVDQHLIGWSHFMPILQDLLTTTE